MKKAIYFSAIFFSFFLIINSCSKKSEEINSPVNEKIDFLSGITNGCITSSSLKIEDQLPLLVATYKDGNLDVSLNYRIQCAAKIKNSVEMDKGKINIFLADTSLGSARCICTFNSQFQFATNDLKEILISVSIKSYSSTEFSEVLDTVITLK